MSDNPVTPITAGTALATKDIGGVQYPKSLITDQAGADAIGLVTASPAANTLLGRLAAIVASAAAAEPASTAAAVVKSDATVIAGMRALWVGGAGDVTATIGGADVVFTAVSAGTLLPIKATKIKAATTATNMVSIG